jgi:hypothetical protein
MAASEENYTFLLAKVDSFIRKYYLNKVLKGVLFLLASALIAFVFIISAEHVARFNSFVRAVLFYTFISINLWVFIAYFFIPLLSYLKLGKSITHEQA